MLERIWQMGRWGFRAVLSRQGESDAQQAAVREIDAAEIREMRAEAGWDFAWFVAEVSYHGPSDTATREIGAKQEALCTEGRLQRSRYGHADRGSPTGQWHRGSHEREGPGSAWKAMGRGRGRVVGPGAIGPLAVGAAVRLWAWCWIWR